MRACVEPPGPQLATERGELDRPVLGSLAWLSGTWVSEDATGPRTIEHWLVPDGGSMLGVNRSVVDGRTVFFEYLRIEAEEDGIVYLASPRGRDPPTRFTATESGPQWIAFENPEHDFPQRIEYRREDARLTMTISGIEQGQRRTSSWSLVRASPHGASPAS